MSVAVFPGSFDPITLGHLDIVRRGATLFDSVIIGVARNAAKKALLELDDRLRLARLAVADLPNVTVEAIPGLLVDFCREREASTIVKGLRSGSDLDDEVPMAAMNRHLGGVETVFVPASGALLHVASTLVRDVARYGGDISDLVTPEVATAVYAALGTRP
ncbi:pantetheine-phosphate adenylyltransferase [Rarobacter faecitabidus]|uniref:pantetheine-phosphate adenylyltransferase n=1 Tax=Rarobacter faecitabidus TaxID=13243 RepID=UPI0011500880|nr:pantetheine-phosphate adenylyltransferase [Rarobacter faecitabidus]